ncbi:MAG TPA: RNA-binding cell elongation regulator Jag/EloR [Clostridia bacterium]|nr:RNA-binding cell elongation regulator Jag/EloR [Clostridia bacterium]
MRSIEASGKSVDEAIFKGLSELGTSIDEVEIQILQQESKGVFGIGAKPAIVKLTEREPEEVILPDYLKNPSERRESRPFDREPRRDRPSEPRRPRPEQKEAPSAPKIERMEGAQAASEEAMTAPAPRAPRPQQERQQPRSDRPRQNRDDRNHQGSRRPQEQRMPEKEKIAYTEEAAEGNRAADFLKGVVSRMGVEAKVLAAQDSDGLKLYIDSETMGILIGHRGETLDALQYLCSLCLNRNRKEEGYLRVNIDTEGYRDKREQTLVRLARRLAAQVKATGKPRTLEPMNPYERRVLHATLQNNPYVSTHSEGEEPNRRVIITPKQNNKV